MVRAVLEFKKRDLFWVVPLVLFIGVGFGIAAVNPNVMGHGNIWTDDATGNVGIGAAPENRLDVMSSFITGTSTEMFVGQDHTTGAASGRYGIGLEFEHSGLTKLGHIITYYTGIKRKVITINVSNGDVIIPGNLEVGGTINGGGGYSPSSVSGWSGTGAKKLVLPNGLIMYFGYATSKTIDISGAGFTDVFSVQITPDRNPSSTSYYAPRVRTFTTSSIVIYNYGIAANGYYYTVIGK